MKNKVEPILNAEAIIKVNGLVVGKMKSIRIIKMKPPKAIKNNRKNRKLIGIRLRNSLRLNKGLMSYELLNQVMRLYPTLRQEVEARRQWMRPFSSDAGFSIQRKTE